MNLGLLFNTLGAAIHDGIPEDAEVIANDDGEGRGDVKAVWYYSGPLEDRKHVKQILISSYGVSGGEGITILWEAPE